MYKKMTPKGRELPNSAISHTPEALPSNVNANIPQEDDDVKERIS